jgi:hypothetical protein
MISAKIHNEEITYTGSELRSLFLYENGLKGDGVFSWIGPCDVKTSHLVDAEDRIKSDHIKAASMVHFLCEFFHKDIFYAICVQRLMAEIVIDVIKDKTGKTFRRKGDDLYFDNRKLNVSIATVSPLSALVHFAVNIDPAGAPVPAVGLEALGVQAMDFTQSFLEKFHKELQEIEDASVKVFSVK